MGTFEDTATTLTSERPEAYCGICDRSYPIDLSICPVDGTKLVRFKAQSDQMIGRVLDGRYRIETKLGQGGMGAVYRGRQLSMEREVAIKVVHSQIAADRDAAKRFLREARLASSLNAPGIVSVFEFGQTDDGVLYLVMELIDGRPLSDLLRAKIPLDPGRVAMIALQLCDALVVAHGAGIIHRDLKPANIITVDTPSGEVIKVLDFGIAKAVDTPSITSTQGMIGTPIYMAPEQFEGRSDVRSDMYSLGCVLYELVSGAPPFWATDINALLTKHLVETPPALPAGVPTKLVRAIERLLEKEPGQRFQSAAELRNALKGAVPYKPGPIIRTSMLEVPDPHATTGRASAVRVTTMDTAPIQRRFRLPILLGAAVAAAALGIAVFFLVRPAKQAPATSNSEPTTTLAGSSASPAAPPAVPAVAPAPLAEAPADAGVALAAAGAATGTAQATPNIVRPTATVPSRKKPIVKKPITDKPKTDGTVELPFVKTK